VILEETHRMPALFQSPRGLIDEGRCTGYRAHEKITIPKDAMGFISFKARYKMKGLVNVSGFHVDPGFRGPLIFAVFNAGPAPVHLQQGWPLFLLWLADLDAPSAKRKSVPTTDGIPPDIINSITGVVDSIYELEKRLEDNLEKLAEEDKSLSNRIHEMEKKQQKVLIWLGIAGVVIGMVVGGTIRNLISPHDNPVAADVSINNRLPSDKPGSAAVLPDTHEPAGLEGGKQSDAGVGGSGKQKEAASHY